MRLLIDEDQASRTLLAALADIDGRELLPPIRETSDDDVWRRAQREGAAILTGNAKDFVPWARDAPQHAGLLLVTRQNRPGDLTSTQIAHAITSIVEAYPDGVAGLTLVVNAFAATQR